MPYIPEMPIQELDYDLDDTMVTSSPEHLKALGDGTRLSILDLLLERSASTSQLAEALAKPKGTVAHHLNVLLDAGLIQVVRTRQVRAMTEKFFGRSARTFLLRGGFGPEHFLRQAMAEVEHLEVDEKESKHGIFTLRHARIPHERAAEYVQRLAELSDEFAAEARDGDVVYGMILGVYPSRQPMLPADPSTEEAE